MMQQKNSAQSTQSIQGTLTATGSTSPTSNTFQKGKKRSNMTSTLTDQQNF